MRRRASRERLSSSTSISICAIRLRAAATLSENSVQRYKSCVTDLAHRQFKDPQAWENTFFSCDGLVRVEGGQLVAATKQGIESISQGIEVVSRSRGIRKATETTIRKAPDCAMQLNDALAIPGIVRPVGSLLAKEAHVGAVASAEEFVSRRGHNNLFNRRSDTRLTLRGVEGGAEGEEGEEGEKGEDSGGEGSEGGEGTVRTCLSCAIRGQIGDAVGWNENASTISCAGVRGTKGHLILHPYHAPPGCSSTPASTTGAGAIALALGIAEQFQSCCSKTSCVSRASWECRTHAFASEEALVVVMFHADATRVGIHTDLGVCTGIGPYPETEAEDTLHILEILQTLEKILCSAASSIC
ncbi:hypothetical protein FB45DRAFT_1075652 [Roridomyces roridus]|uniref:Uncharacterized protein n=1 Tax=Roridomyces roridus TaxID=1738132 RepID=A0AAD7G1Z4_9AGAR|nr:hypothetical protein FB45DRAFT_1075652 [Roridomyces roridus]